MKHTKYLILAAFVALFFASTAHALLWIAPSRFVTAAATWVDSIDPASTNSYPSASAAGQIFGAVVTPSTSGNATKLRVRMGFVNAAEQIKIALLTTSGTVLGSGVVTATVGSDRWEEVTITPAAVSSGTSYVVMYIFQSSSTGQGRRLTSAGGVGRENYDQVFSTFPSGTVSLSTTSDNHCVGMYVQ